MFQKIKELKKFYLHEKVMKNFVKSYVLVSIIPLTVVLISMFLLNFGAVKKNNIDALHTATIQTKNTLESGTYAYHSIALQINNSSYAQRLYSVDLNEVNETDTISMFKLSSQIKQMYLMTNSILEVFVHFKNSGYCVSSARALPYESMYYTLSETKIHISDVANWEILLNSELDGGYITLAENPFDNSLFYIQKMPMIGDQEGSIVIPIKSEYLSEIFNLETFSESIQGIVTATGEIIYSNSVLGNFSLDASLLLKGDGVSDVQGGTLFYEKIGETNSYVFTWVTNRNIYSNLTTVVLVTVIIMIITFLLSMILMLYYTVRNYNPIRELFDLTKNEVSFNNENGQDFNVYSQIRETLINAMDVKRNLGNKKNISETFENSSIIYDVLKSKHARTFLDTRYGIDPNCPIKAQWICIKVLWIDRFSTLFRVNNDEEYAQFDCMSLFEDVFLGIIAYEKFKVSMIRPTDFTILMEAVNKKVLRDALKKSVIFLRENYSYEIAVVVSSAKKPEGILNSVLQQMFDECDYLLEHDNILRMDNVVFYEEILPDSYVLTDNLFQMERKMLFEIRSGNYKRASNELVQLQNLLNSRIMSDCDDIANSNDDLNIDKKSKIINEIIEIVEEKYWMPMISVSAIADQIGKNVDYVSRTFRSKMGVGLLDYIHHKRIFYAKNILLNEKDISVNELSKKVGYLSADSFIRVFKRIEGTTPGSYKEKYQSVDGDINSPKTT